MRREALMVRIDVKTTERLKNFVKNEIGIDDRTLYTIVIRKAINFAIENKEEFLKFMRGEGNGRTT